MEQLKFTEAISLSGFETIDFIIMVVYVILLVSLGMFLSRERAGEGKSVNDYFLAGHTLTWWAVGASLIAANISAEQLIGMAGTGYADGIAIAAYEIMAALTLLVIGKFLLPFMIERKIFTIPQFLRERYNDGVGLAFSILWLFLYVFINLTSVAWLGALAIEQILGLQGLTVSIFGLEVSLRMVIIIALFLIAGLYSINGGLTSVAWTDVMQVTFLIGGGLVTAYFALVSVAGNDGTFIDGFNKIYTYLTTGDYARDTHFHLIIRESSAIQQVQAQVQQYLIDPNSVKLADTLKSFINQHPELDAAGIAKAYHPNAYDNVPGIAAVVGAMWLTNFGYWGFNQYIIQKGLAARSINEAKRGFVFAGFLKLLIPFIVLVPGLCAFYMSQNADQFLHIQGAINVSDDAYPWLIRNFTPTGIKGLSFAALTAAVISSLASMFNSTSTIFTMDIYKKYIDKDATDSELVNVGRIVAIVALIIAAFAVNPLLSDLDQAFQYIQEYSGFIYPGVIIVFCFGLFWKRASSTAAVWTALIAIPLGIAFKVYLPDMPFLFRSGYVFIILLVFFVLVSYLDRKYVSVELPSEAERKAMLRWAAILGGTGLFFIIMAAVVVLMGNSTTLTYYLNDIGFQAFFFFGVMVGGNSIWLYSNSKDKKAVPKALPIDLGLFRTTRGYTYCTIAFTVITLILYILFW
ncbi:MAG: sodium/solute symporter [Bacteroidaceae bacterium]|nr:sodium/solute symporter [Bacteroidaceae bacterium]